MKKRLFLLFVTLTMLLTGCTMTPADQTANPDEVVLDLPSDGNNNETDAPTPSYTPNNTPSEPMDNQQNTSKPSYNETPSTQTPDDDDSHGAIIDDSWNKPDVTGDLNLWVSPVLKSAEKKRPFYAVKWQYNAEKEGYYLYLPTEGTLSAMQVWFEGTTTCKIGNNTVKNGQEVNFLEEGTCNLTLGGSEYPLTVMKSANIGSMYLTTKSGKMSYIHKEKGNAETGAMRYVNAQGEVLYSGNLTQIRGRGNATWDKPKKPYQIKLEKKTELVEGAGEATTWLLLANYCEKTMLNNTVALNLAYDAGLTNTCRSEYMDLYCNNEYMGTYQVCEKVQIAKNRIEITDLGKATEKLNSQPLESYGAFGTQEAVKGTSKGYNVPKDPADITGGYLLEIENNERYVPETSGFVTTWGTAVVIKEPEYASKAQVAYISNFFQEFEDAVRAPDGINPKTGKRFDEYFDLTSLAKKYILEEFVKNIDADVTSQYYYKPSDKESKVGFCGPVWDYDNSFDVMTSGDKKDGLYASTRKKKIYFHLVKHDFFMDEVRKEWKNNYLPHIAVCLGEKRNKNISLQSLDSYQKLLTPSAEMNYTLWTGAGGLKKPINSGHIDTGDTYPEHIDYLRTYMEGRRFELNQIWMSS